MDSSNICTLTLSCADKPGLVAAVATLLADSGGNILDAQQFNDQLTDRFFMRVVFDLDPAVSSKDAFKARFAALEESAPRFRGVFVEGQTYHKGALVVSSGSLWHCRCECEQTFLFVGCS